VKIATLVVLVSSFVGISAHAGEALNFKIHHQYQSPRALGMGDAFVAVADDYSAMFYNPAGLARREDGQINLSMEGMMTSSFNDFISDVTNASKGTGTSAEKQAAILDVIKNVYGTNYSLRLAPTSGIWVRPNWGFAVIPLDASINLAVHNQVGPAINLTMYGDSTIAYSYAKDIPWIKYSRTSIGTTLKFVNRVYQSKALAALDLAGGASLTDDYNMQEGYTVDADIGMLVTPQLPSDDFWKIFRLAKPTFGVVMRNALESGFGQSLKLVNKNQTTAPEKLYRVVDVGMKWEYPSIFIFGGRGVLDVRDIMHPNFNTRKGLHVGFEFDWRMTSWWKGQYRFGVNQGYFTAGASALFGVFNLDLVTYGEDVGTYSSPQQSRTYMVKMNMDF
jgi:hypothetical protein